MCSKEIKLLPGWDEKTLNYIYVFKKTLDYKDDRYKNLDRYSLDVDKYDLILMNEYELLNYYKENIEIEKWHLPRRVLLDHRNMSYQAFTNKEAMCQWDKWLDFDHWNVEITAKLFYYGPWYEFSALPISQEYTEFEACIKSLININEKPYIIIKRAMAKHTLSIPIDLVRWANSVNSEPTFYQTIQVTKELLLTIIEKKFSENGCDREGHTFNSLKELSVCEALYAGKLSLEGQGIDDIANELTSKYGTSKYYSNKDKEKDKERDAKKPTTPDNFRKARNRRDKFISLMLDEYSVDCEPFIPTKELYRTRKRLKAAKQNAKEKKLPNEEISFMNSCDNVNKAPGPPDEESMLSKAQAAAELKIIIDGKG